MSDFEWDSCQLNQAYVLTRFNSVQFHQIDRTEVLRKVDDEVCRKVDDFLYRKVKIDENILMMMKLDDSIRRNTLF